MIGHQHEPKVSALSRFVKKPSRVSIEHNFMPQEAENMWRKIDFEVRVTFNFQLSFTAFRVYVVGLE